MDKTSEDAIVNIVGAGERVYVPHNHAVSAEVTEDELIVKTQDGRIIHTPLAWFPFLVNATPQQRQKFRVAGVAIDWDELDDGVSMETILLGLPEQTGAGFKSREK